MRIAMPTAVWGLLACVGALCAGTAEETYKATFGEEAAKVTRTPEKEDDVAFAGKLLEAAQKTTDQPALQVLLCRKVCEFAMTHPSGCPTAKQAAGLWAQLDPNQADQARQTMLDLAEAMHKRAQGPDKRTTASYAVEAMLCCGDAELRAGHTQDSWRLYQKASSIARANRCGWELETSWRLEEGRHHQQADRQIAALQAAIKANPKDIKAAKDLAMLHLVEKDDPAKAMGLLEASQLNGEFRSKLEPAAKDIGKLDEESCLKLRDWYKELAGDAKGHAEVYMLQRAKTYAARFLELHKGKDLTRVAAEEQFDAIGRDLAQACAKVRGGWLGLLHLACPHRGGLWGWRWHLTPQGITSPPTTTDAQAIPYEFPPEYELHASFTRLAGIAPVVLVCASGQKRFRCAFGTGGNTKCGLEPLRGGETTASEKNPTVRPMSVINGHRYMILIQVRKKGIKVHLDGDPIIEFLDDGSRLIDASTNTGWGGTVGFGCYGGPTQFHSFDLLPVSGAGRFIDRKAAKE